MTKSNGLLPPTGEVPHASKLRLYEEVARLNIPLLDENADSHPLPRLLEVMKTEHLPIYRWGAHAGNNLNTGLGGDEEYDVPERQAFDNTFIASYGLIRAGYDEAGIQIPGAEEPSEWYLWIRDEPQQTVGEMFTVFNQRQHALLDTYPTMLEAIQTWAADRIPGHGTGDMVGAVALAAAEMYYAFVRTEEVVALERQFDS